MCISADLEDVLYLPEVLAVVPQAMEVSYILV